MSPYKYAGSQEVNGGLQDVNESEYCHMVIYGSQLWLWVQKPHPPAAQIHLFVRSSQAKESGLKGKEFKLGFFQIEDELRVCKKYKIKKRIILNWLMQSYSRIKDNNAENMLSW